MNKKMKKVSFDSYEDVRARYKHETLLQDYMELQEETEAAKNNMMALKQKKLILEAEVRFLRQRHKFLLKNKSPTPLEQTFVKPQPTQYRKNKKENARVEKQANLRNVLPAQKKKAPRSTIPSHDFDINLENSLYGVKEQSSVQRVVANQRVRINGPKAVKFLDSSPKNEFSKSQEPVGQTRKPVIDLNQISIEEEEYQDRSQPLDHPSGLIRNIGAVSVSGSGLGSNGQPAKRKISWQDPVALRV